MDLDEQGIGPAPVDQAPTLSYDELSKLLDHATVEQLDDHKIRMQLITRHGPEGVKTLVAKYAARRKYLNTEAYLTELRRPPEGPIA